MSAVSSDPNSFDFARWEAEVKGEHMWAAAPVEHGWVCLVCSTLITSGDDIRIRMACPGPSIGTVAS